LVIHFAVGKQNLGFSIPDNFWNTDTKCFGLIF